jgi:hypothetical protein
LNVHVVDVVVLQVTFQLWLPGIKEAGPTSHVCPTVHILAKLGGDLSIITSHRTEGAVKSKGVQLRFTSAETAILFVGKSSATTGSGGVQHLFPAGHVTPRG